MRNKILVMSVLAVLCCSCTKEKRQTIQSASMDTIPPAQAINDSELIVLNIPQEGIRFPIGWDDKGTCKDEAGQDAAIYDETGTQVITEGFLDYSYAIGRYEVSYGLWKEVYDWATKGAGKAKGYVFSQGEQGYAGDPEAVDAIRQKEAVWDCGIRKPHDGHPVTAVSWYDCIVWCNAYSEMMGAMPVYYKKAIADGAGAVKPENIPHYDRFVLRDAKTEKQDCDSAVALAAKEFGKEETANGFRLPTYLEWQLAAKLTDKEEFVVRKNGKPLTGMVNKKEWFFTKGAAVSGGQYALSNHSMAKAILQDANHYAHIPLYDLSVSPCPFSTLAIGSLQPNRLNIYDMSGNVAEWCFDYMPKVHTSPAGRALQGGTCGGTVIASAHGDKKSYNPNETSLCGLRICLSIAKKLLP
ncbi:MAG: formylglycine-generating enzyme family protein [Treponema sp.]